MSVAHQHQRSSFFILCLLGILSVTSPFAIDLYLSAFSQMADDLKTTSAVISLSLSAYFIGLAFGQCIYGPLLDRFGRKKPIYVGLTIFCLSSIGCMLTTNVDTLIWLRLLQGFGGCVAQVGAITMVHDFFPVEQSAKIFSLLFLFIGASPLLAPSIGSVLTVYFGWRSVFVFMFVLVSIILAGVFFLLPEGHKPDKTISLKPKDIAKTYWEILKDRTFLHYAAAGAFSFAGLFCYVAGAPIIFMEEFHVGPKTFGGIFAMLAFGFIGGSQLNVFMLRHFKSETIFSYALPIQVICGFVFLIGTSFGWLGLIGTLVMFFIFLSCVGISNPNGSALALAPFSKNAGSASALLGTLQLGCGALVSTSISILNAKSSLPIIGVLFTTALVGYGIHLLMRVKR